MMAPLFSLVLLYSGLHSAFSATPIDDAVDGPTVAETPFPYGEWRFSDDAHATNPANANRSKSRIVIRPDQTLTEYLRHETPMTRHFRILNWTATGGSIEIGEAKQLLQIQLERFQGQTVALALTDSVNPSDRRSYQRQRGGDSWSRCPESVHQFGGWQGEYPNPVLDVQRPWKAPARIHPCDAKAEVKCTISPGLYHPWSSERAVYRTLIQTQRYRVIEETTVGERTLRPGQEVEVLGYHGEGFCAWRQETDFDGPCPDLIGESRFEALNDSSSEPFSDVQLIHATCNEGFDAFIDVSDATFTSSQVRRGTIVGFGEVGHAK